MSENTIRVGRLGILNDEKTVSSSTKIREIRINSTPTECKVDEEMLMARHEVILKNYSSYYVYWSFNENMVYGEGQLLRSGDLNIVSVEPYSNTKIYALSKIDDVPLFITEVVSWA